MPEFVTSSPEETFLLGESLGRLLRAGDVVALSGDLGSGKTQFSKGIARGVGVPAETVVTSPTYTVVNEYAGAIPLYHFDFYRLGGMDDLEAIGFDDYLSGNAVSVIEWPEGFEGALPADCVVTVALVPLTEERRRVTISAVGERLRERLKTLSAL